MPNQKNTPHLTPSKLVGQRFPRDTFGDTKIALVAYCPPPRALGNYNPITTINQYFIHVSPDSVKKLSYNGINFLSLVHVYGGPVSATTVEELAYYNFDYILAYGLAGGLGTKNLKMGDFYQVDSALVADGTTPHYTNQPIVSADPTLITAIAQHWQHTNPQPIHAVHAITGDALYREDDTFLDSARAQGCDIVNLDSSHLYTVSQVNSDNKRLKAIECGVISDVTGSDPDQDWDSNLSVMLSSESTSALNPLELTSKIVEFYIEQLAPLLLAQQSSS
jgi:uridine phosphorylase